MKTYKFIYKKDAERKIYAKDIEEAEKTFMEQETDWDKGIYKIEVRSQNE